MSIFLPLSFLASFGFDKKKCNDGGRQDYACRQLGRGHIADDEYSPVISAKAFNGETRGTVKDQKPKQDLAVKFLFCVQQQENNKNNEPTCR